MKYGIWADITVSWKASRQYWVGVNRFTPELYATKELAQEVADGLNKHMNGPFTRDYYRYEAREYPEEKDREGTASTGGTAEPS